MTVAMKQLVASTAPLMTSHQSSVLRIDLCQESDCIYSESYGILHFQCILRVVQLLITLNKKCLLLLNLIFSSVVSQVILYVYIVRSGNRRLRKNTSHFGG